MKGKDEISLRTRMRGLRQALHFGKAYPITKEIGVKAPKALTRALEELSGEPLKWPK